MDAENLPVAIEPNYDLTMTRTPAVVLEEARSAAKELTAIIAKKAKPVMFNGEQYLEFEDWQTIAKFYGVTAKVTFTEFVQYADARGFSAKAAAFHIASGQEISIAEAVCLSDEPNWSRKSLYQLKSMAQTRACAKVLRNVFSWVAVLAGYKPTPAEEFPLPGPEPAATSPVSEIRHWLGEMCGGDVEKMQNQIRGLTTWNDKETKEEKWVDLDSLPRIAKAKPDWLKRIHGRVSEAYDEWNRAR